MLPRPRPHYGRTKVFKTVRIVSWRDRDGDWHRVENIDEERIGKYPDADEVERARAIVIAGKIELNVDGVWYFSDETKYLPTYTPFTKKHTIDDFAKESEDHYSFRWV